MNYANSWSLQLLLRVTFPLLESNFYSLDWLETPEEQLWVLWAERPFCPNDPNFRIRENQSRQLCELKHLFGVGGEKKHGQEYVISPESALSDSCPAAPLFTFGSS